MTAKIEVRFTVERITGPLAGRGWFRKSIKGTDLADLMLGVAKANGFQVEVFTMVAGRGFVRVSVNELERLMAPFKANGFRV
jgi:hypothetical protein